MKQIQKVKDENKGRMKCWKHGLGKEIQIKMKRRFKKQKQRGKKKLENEFGNASGNEMRQSKEESEMK